MTEVIYLFLEIDFVEKISRDWLNKNPHIVCLVNSENKVIYSNTCHQEELDLIVGIKKDNLVNIDGLLVAMTGALPVYEILRSLIYKLRNMRLTELDLNLEVCSQFKIFSTIKDEFVLFVSFKMKKEE